jgi:hypothetical protein
MRDDMSKVIVERPRIPAYTRKGRVIKDTDLYTSHEGMRTAHVRNYNGKQLNENLAPLLRFLTSRVGQNWDSVYSEICENIKITNAVQDHIRIHVKQYVETSTSIDNDGNIWINRGRPCLLADDRLTRFYVDPISKLLCQNPLHGSWKAARRERNQQHREELEARQRSFPGGIELRLCKGIWYQVELREVPKSFRRSHTRADGSVYEIEIPGSAFDIIKGVNLYRRGNRVTTWDGQWHGSLMYCRTKRQLSSTELKKYGVRNS